MRLIQFLPVEFRGIGKAVDKDQRQKAKAAHLVKGAQIDLCILEIGRCCHVLQCLKLWRLKSK